MIMSNPLKRVLDPDVVDHVIFNVSRPAITGVNPHRPFQQETWQYGATFPDAPRQSQYVASTYMNPGR